MKLNAADFRLRTRAIGLAAICVSAGAGVALAQATGFSRVMLQDQPLRAEGQHTVTAKAQFETGAYAGRHTHPGEEIGYALEGYVELSVEGRPTQTLKPGDVFFIPAGVPHDGHNVGSTKAALLSVFVVEKGRPLATPAP